MIYPALFKEGKRSDDRQRISALHGLKIVVEVEKERLPVARFDKAIRMAVKVLFQRLAPHEMQDILGQHLSFEVRNGPRLGCRHIGSVTNDKNILMRFGLERVRIRGDKIKLVAQSGALDDGVTHVGWHRHQ